MQKVKKGKWNIKNQIRQIYRIATQTSLLAKKNLTYYLFTKSYITSLAHSSATSVTKSISLSSMIKGGLK